MDTKKIIYTEPCFSERSIFTIMENVALYSFPFVVFYFFYLIIAKMPLENCLSIIPITTLISYTLADFICGIVHWVGDTYGDENTPFIGHNLVQPFRWHHISPRAMTTYSISTTLGSSVMLALPFIALCFYQLPSANSYTSQFTLFLLSTLCLFSAFANLGHKYAHRRPTETPFFIKKMQKFGLLLSPTHHNLHHIAPHMTHYCVFTGWCNGFLDKINFWRNMEGFLGVFGVHPHPSSKVSVADITIVRLSNPDHPLHTEKETSIA